MNLSGQSVQALRHFYKINAEDIILVSDDLDQPFGLNLFLTTPLQTLNSERIKFIP